MSGKRPAADGRATDVRFDQFLQAVKQADLADGNLRITAHSSAVSPADWERIEETLKAPKTV